MGSLFGNIEVRGARENNLKNISLDIPRRQITVFTGVSGSGKSSLVFDTIAAESQRLINERFSTFVQMFLPRYGQPDADALNNLSTAIIVDQNVGEAKDHLLVEKATLNNLRNVTVKIPKGVLTVVAGVAGSGKSSLIHGSLVPLCPGAVVVDQALTPGSRRSNLATYSGMADAIRKAFATANRVQPALFSSNSKGACPPCQGLGVMYTDLQHMDPVATRCEACDGRCFTDEVLALKLRGKSINEVLALSVREAHEYFVERPVLATLRTLQDVGLAYVALGQRLNTLSGGERQRLKLAEELGKPSEIVILDEPTTGLHMADVAGLIGLLDRMVDNGSTVIVIEHNLDVVARADWVVDMGPGAGNEGGRIVFEGVPARLVKHAASLTGQHLARRVA